MKHKTLPPGNDGFLLVDLVVAMTILSIVLISLFSAVIGIKQSRSNQESVYQESLDYYESSITEQAEKR